MPELPEVETVVCDLNDAGLVGRKVVATRIFWPRTLAFPGTRAFKVSIQGRAIEAVTRRGKHIVLHLSGNGVLLIHLRMSGRLTLAPDWPSRDGHARMAWRLVSPEAPSDAKVLCFLDPRKFGRVWLLTPGQASPLDALGVEPLSAAFTVAYLLRSVTQRKASIKALLLNQTLIAGIGNIYADEALWHARLHPLRSGDSLSHAEAARLVRAVRYVLRHALRSGGTSLGAGRSNFYGLHGQPGRHLSHLNVYRRNGQPCPACARPIERLVVVQRSTHVCSACQSLPRPRC